MALNTEISVATKAEPVNITLSAGTSVIFIGANGAGKTRLGVFIDQKLSASSIEVHRIAAHRSLNLNPAVVPPSLEVATNRLRFGHDNGSFQHKHGHRFQSKPETAMLSDFDHLLSALYAENNDVSIAYRQKCIASPGDTAAPPPAKIDKLKAIWETILPHRELIILGGNIKTKTKDEVPQEYAASDMSDGERVIFYLIGQALLAQSDTVLIFDEPELHINKSVLARLWDEIESSRPDCAFLYITHDVEFAASRHAATKYALRAYYKVPSESWDIEIIPDEAEIPDDIVATIIGSRRPVMFVEGDGGSLDSALYRRVYGGFTVIPVGSCDQVIHTVASFAARSELHRIGCAGIVDADGRTDAEATYLATRGVYRLPVSEVENLLLLPDVFLAIAEALKFENADALSKLDELKTFVFAEANVQIDAICLRYTRRRIDAEMKKIGLASSDVASLVQEFQTATNSISPNAIFDEVKRNLQNAIAQQNYELVLQYYDNKGLLSEVAKKVGYNQKSLEEFVGRALRSKDEPKLLAALIAYLPTVTPRP